MRQSKFLNSMVTHLEEFAVNAIVTIMNIAEIEEWEIPEPVKMSFYPDYIMIAVWQEGDAYYVRGELEGEHIREFELADSAMVPLQDLQEILQQMERTLNKE